jgi:hypothetical protein
VTDACCTFTHPTGRFRVRCLPTPGGSSATPQVSDPPINRRTGSSQDTQEVDKFRHLSASSSSPFGTVGGILSRAAPATIVTTMQAAGSFTTNNTPLIAPKDNKRTTPAAVRTGIPPFGLTPDSDGSSGRITRQAGFHVIDHGTVYRQPRI